VTFPLRNVERKRIRGHHATEPLGQPFNLEK
jgi:hypothetical protein